MVIIVRDSNLSVVIYFFFVRHKYYGWIYGWSVLYTFSRREFLLWGLNWEAMCVYINIGCHTIHKWWYVWKCRLKGYFDHPLAWWNWTYDVMMPHQWKPSRFISHNPIYGLKFLRCLSLIPHTNTHVCEVEIQNICVWFWKMLQNWCVYICWCHAVVD